MSTTETEHAPARRSLWRNPNTWFVAEALLALTLALILLDAKSFSSDEGTTALWTGDTWGFLLTGIRHVDANAIGYDVFQKLWRVLGDHETMLRIPSVVAVAASVFVVAKLAQRLFDVRTGLVAGAILATSSLLIEHGQIARSYGLTVLVTALATYAFLVAIERGNRRAWVVFTALTVLGLYLHFFAGLVLLAQIVSLLFSGRSLRSLRPLMISVVVTGVLCLPIAAAIKATGGDQINWIGEPTADIVRITLLGLGGGSLRSLALFACFVVAGVALVRILRTQGRGNPAWRLGLVSTWLVLPPVVAFAASFTVQPVWVTRYFVVVLAPIAIVAAYGLTRISADWRIVAGATVAIMLLGIPTLREWYAKDSEDFRSAATSVLARTQPGDGIVFCADYNRRVFEYYADQLGGRRPDPISPPKPWGSASNFSRLRDPEQIRKALERHPRIWIVSWRREGASSPLCNGFPARTLGSRDFGGVTVQLVAPVG